MGQAKYCRRPSVPEAYDDASNRRIGSPARSARSDTCVTVRLAESLFSIPQGRIEGAGISSSPGDAKRRTRVLSLWRSRARSLACMRVKNGDKELAQVIYGV